MLKVFTACVMVYIVLHCVHGGRRLKSDTETLVKKETSNKPKQQRIWWGDQKRKSKKSKSASRFEDSHDEKERMSQLYKLGRYLKEREIIDQFDRLFGTNDLPLSQYSSDEMVGDDYSNQLDREDEDLERDVTW